MGASFGIPPSQTAKSIGGFARRCHEFCQELRPRPLAVVPIDFIRVPLTALVGWLVYAERIDLLTLVGTLLILAGNLLNLGRFWPRRAAD